MTMLSFDSVFLFIVWSLLLIAIAYSIGDECGGRKERMRLRAKVSDECGKESAMRVFDEEPKPKRGTGPEAGR